MFQLSRKGAFAFSLIEILVAIAIVGVLATLAVNWLGASSAKSKEVKCLNNLKQLGAATQLYCAENMGALPMRKVGDPPKYNSPPWYQPLVSYVSANMKNGSVIAIEKTGIKTFQCPAYKLPSMDNITYAPDVQCANLSMISITQPSKKIWLVDSIATASYYVNVNAQSSGINYPHKQRASVLFFDGHTELLTQAELSKIKSFAFNPTTP
jgi:prepilin-type N-terminal cleavage/methylation domain-containing protein/prepilin-type processing-associated H-X9-DG protein